MEKLLKEVREVAGSNPVVPTIKLAGRQQFNSRRNWRLLFRAGDSHSSPLKSDLNGYALQYSKQSFHVHRFC